MARRTLLITLIAALLLPAAVASGASSGTFTAPGYKGSDDPVKTTGSPGDGALSTKLLTIGTNGNDPSILVDEAGTAHITWMTPGSAGVPDEVHYCRLKRGASACDPTPPLPPAVNPLHAGPDAINESSSGPKIYDADGTLVILDERCCDFWPVPGGTTSSPTVAWVSTDGGNTFTGPAPVGDVQGGIDGPAVAYGTEGDPRISTISQVTTGGTFFQAISPGAYASGGANLGDAPGLSRAWYDGNVTLDGGVPVAGFSDDTGNVMRRANSATADLNNIANWGPPVRLPGENGRLAGGPDGLLAFDTEGKSGDAYYVHRITGSTAGPGFQVTQQPNASDGRFIQTPSGKVIAVWEDGSIVRQSTSTNGTTWPKKPLTLVPSDGNEPDVGAADDGGGFAVVHRNGGTATPANIVVRGFGPQTPTGRPGIGGVAGGSDPGDDTTATSACSTQAFGKVKLTLPVGCFLGGKNANGKAVSVAEGDLSLNGLEIVPDGVADSTGKTEPRSLPAGTARAADATPIQILINAKQHTIDTTGRVRVLAVGSGIGDPVEIWRGELHTKIADASGGGSLFPGGLPALSTPELLKGFPFVGDVDPKIEGDGVSIPLTLKLPAYFGGVTGAATLHISPASGVALQSLHIHVGGGLIDVLPVGPIDIDYKADGDVWNGAITVGIPGAASASINGTVQFKGGKFNGAYLSIPLGTPGIPIFDDVYLYKLGGGFDLDPLTLEVGADIGAIYPSPINPQTSPHLIEVHGMVKAIFGGAFQLKIDGTADLAGIEVGDAHFAYQTSPFQVTGTLNAHIGSDSLGVKSTAFVGLSKKGFEALGDGSVCFGGCVGVQTALSTIGVAGCIDYAIGALSVSYRWSGDLNGSLTSCLTGDVLIPGLTPTPAARSAGTRQAAPGGVGAAFTVPPGSTDENLNIVGTTGAPSVVLTAPDGHQIVPTYTRKPVDGVFGGQAPEARQTIVDVTSPKAGAWRVDPLPGSSPIAVVRTAQGLKTPKVTGVRVTGHGHARRLFYDLHATKGTHVTFSELVGRAPHPLGTARAGAHSLAFKPADGPAGRRTIIARIGSGGIVVLQPKVAHYTAPAPVRAGRVPGLRITHTASSLRIAFGRASDAVSYIVRVRLADGRRLLFFPRGRRAVTVARVGRSDRATVSVQGVAANTRKGPTTTKRR